VLHLIPEFIKPYGKAEFQNRLSGTSSLILIAEEGSKPVGFKCGYELDAGTFYSWMGGVLPEHRRFGFAAGLLHEMEYWCRTAGYRRLTFKTLNRHKGMLLFSIKKDFSIVKVESSKKDSQLRIWLAKDL